MKRSLAAVLCVVMLLTVALAGCQTKDPLLGTWEGEIELADMMNELIVGADENMAKYFQFTDLELEITMVFREDKTCSLTIDEGSVEELLNDLVEQMSGGMTKMVEDTLKAYGSTMTVEEYMAYLGTDMETLLKESIGAAISEDTFQGMEQEGTYKVEDGKLYISDAEDGSFTEDDATPYTLKDGKLTLLAPEDAENEEMVKYMFPMELTKVEDAD